MEWTTLASLAARAGKQSYDQRHTIQQYFTKAKAYLDLGQTQIVVTGASGAGKSVLVAQMHGRARDLYYEAPPQSNKVEVEAIALEPWSKLVRVLPGQGARRSQEEVELLDRNDEVEGVIHVVDFGYVVPRDAFAAKSLLERNGLDTVGKLRAYNMESEVKALDALLFAVNRAFNKHKRPKWLLVAVNKVDLYWNIRTKHWPPITQPA